MQEPSFEDALQVLLLQAADEGRGEVLFGECVNRARREIGPFMIGKKFPDVYLECPLKGDPFLDITVLYSQLEPGAKVEHPAAGGANSMLEWFVEACKDYNAVCCGFELDIKEPTLPAAAVHFQPRTAIELVWPFCQSIGEPERADLYLNLAERMPDDWPLSFFGMFRGRPNYPLRVCGYIGGEEKAACADDPTRLAYVFDEVGFSAYDEEMLSEICAYFAAAPGTLDYQFDVYPDGSLGDTFAIDLQFEIEQPEAVRESFECGGASRVMRLFEEHGIADERGKLVPQATFARSLPAKRPDGSIGKYAFTLMPQWAKARWTKGALQPAKMYYFANAGFIDGKSDEAHG